MSIEAHPENPPPGNPQEKLEILFLEAYLASKGYHLKDIHLLPAEVSKNLMTEASIYASNRLAEIETRSNLVNELHDID